MYIVYNISVDEINKINYDVSDEEIDRNGIIRDKVKEILSRQKIKNHYVFESDEIIRTCFPNIRHPQVFISHAHKDQVAVRKLKGFLENHFKLNCFVDSSVWFDINELIQMFMRDLNLPKAPNENILITNVVMMLTTSLTHMLDVCPIIIFVASNNSQTNTEQRNYSDITTQSPWIYHELSMLEKLPRKSPRLDNMMIKRASENICFNYQVNQPQIRELTCRKLSLMESIKRKYSISSEDLFCYYSTYILSLSIMENSFSQNNI